MGISSQQIKAMPHAFKVGVRQSPGRVKGVPNKFTSDVRTAVKIAFDKLGGAEGLIKWAKNSDRNMTAFYTLAGKLIPHQIEGGDPARPVLVATTDQLRTLPDAQLETLVKAVSHFIDKDEAEREGITFENGEDTPLPPTNGSTHHRSKPRVVKLD